MNNNKNSYDKLKRECIDRNFSERIIDRYLFKSEIVIKIDIINNYTKFIINWPKYFFLNYIQRKSKKNWNNRTNLQLPKKLK